MLKNELLKAMSSKLEGATMKDCDAILGAFEEVVLETLREDSEEEVSLGKLGKFKVKEVPERKGTVTFGAAKGEKYVKPAHKEICFKMSKTTRQL